MKQITLKIKQSARWLLVACVAICIPVYTAGPMHSHHYEPNNVPDAAPMSDVHPASRIAVDANVNDRTPIFHTIGRGAVQFMAGGALGFGVGAAVEATASAMGNNHLGRNCGRLASGITLGGSTGAIIAAAVTKNSAGPHRIVDAVFALSDGLDEIVATEVFGDQKAGSNKKMIMRTCFAVGAIAGSGLIVGKLSKAASESTPHPSSQGVDSRPNQGQLAIGFPIFNVSF